MTTTIQSPTAAPAESVIVADVPTVAVFPTPRGATVNAIGQTLLGRRVSRA
jgi:hypothetical protein